jgi:hypothetical protein
MFGCMLNDDDDDVYYSAVDMQKEKNNFSP